MSEKIVPTVYLAVGIPGSGKSTWWVNGIKNGTIPEKGSIRINMDSIRKDLTGDESDQTKNGLVAKIASQNLESALANKIPVIYWDNTGTSAKYRKAVVKETKRAGYECVAIVFDVSLETALVRNAARSRVVPEDVIKRMHQSIQNDPPSMDEGYDNIIYVN